jgi:hypothetical protein
MVRGLKISEGRSGIYALSDMVGYIISLLIIGHYAGLPCNALNVICNNNKYKLLFT